MWDFVVSKVGEWVKAAREIYSVDPVVFVVLLLAMAPIFYYSIFRLVRALAKKNTREIPLWSTIFLAATAIRTSTFSFSAAISPGGSTSCWPALRRPCTPW